MYYDDDSESISDGEGEMFGNAKLAFVSDDEDIFEEDNLAENANDEEDSKNLSKDCEVFSNYKSTFLKLGNEHPQPLCEGSGLSCVSMPPITYAPINIPEEFYTLNGNKPAHLSNPQLEAIVYAHQAHLHLFLDDKKEEVRTGFLLGDGTGIGKSRTLAGIIFEYALTPDRAGLKFIWVTPKTTLFDGAKHELIHFMNNVTILTAGDLKADLADPTVPTVLMLTYGHLHDRSEDKRKLLKKWTGINFEGLIIFDEAHTAKNAYGTKISEDGKAVMKFQDDHKKARVVYSSATAASETHHLLYMNRLHLWGPGTKYKGMDDFQNKLNERGVAALELLAIEMKMRGVFVSRQISFEKVIVEEQIVNLEKRKTFEPVYNRCCQMWELIMIYQKNLKEAKEREARMNKCVVTENFGQWLGTTYAASQKFFQSLLITSKLYTADKIARSELKKNCSVVVGLQQTGESQYEENFCGPNWNKNQPYSNVREILRSVLLSLGVAVGCPRAYFNDGTEKKIGKWNEEDDQTAKKCSKRWEVKTCESHSSKKSTAHSSKSHPPPSKRAKHYDYNFTIWPMYSVGFYQVDLPQTPESLTWSYEEVKQNITSEGLARMFHELSPFLPINPLDELIDRLQNEGPHKKQQYQVAELTGRKYQYIYDTNRCLWNEVKKGRHVMEEEQNNFMDMNKRVCVISNAASTGFSLHADKSRTNQQRRIHITIQYPWSPDHLLQQLGRSHRSNQACYPKYILIKSPVSAEIRFTSIISKRMMQLGAFCSGHSKANILGDRLSDILCSRLGVLAINMAIADLGKVRANASLMAALGIEKIKGEKSAYFAPSKTDAINRTFNRALMMPLKLQETFLETTMKEIEKLRSSESSTLYSPITEFPATDADVTLLRKKQLKFDCHLYKFRISRIASWEFIQTIQKRAQEAGKKCEFYKRRSELMFTVQDSDDSFSAYYPHNRVKKEITSRDLNGWDKETNMAEIDEQWEHQLEMMDQYPGCAHAVNTFGKCDIENCKFRWGVYDFFVLCGKTSEYLGVFETKSSEVKQLRVGKVKYTNEDNAEKAVVGLLIHLNGKHDIEHILETYEG